MLYIRTLGGPRIFWWSVAVSLILEELEQSLASQLCRNSHMLPIYFVPAPCFMCWKKGRQIASTCRARFVAYCRFDEYTTTRFFIRIFALFLSLSCRVAQCLFGRNKALVHLKVKKGFRQSHERFTLLRNVSTSYVVTHLWTQKHVTWHPGLLQSASRAQHYWHTDNAEITSHPWHSAV
jgi:hypothetical protein